MLFHLVNIVTCVPVGQFYHFGADSDTRLGNEDASAVTILIPNQTFYFYNQEQSTLIVSNNFP